MSQDQIVAGRVPGAPARRAQAAGAFDQFTVVQTCCLVVPPENAAALAQAIQTFGPDPVLHALIRLYLLT